MVVIAASGDPLFPFDDVQRLYEQIKAPAQGLLRCDLQYHLIFNECLDAVLPRLMEALKSFADKDAWVAETSAME